MGHPAHFERPIFASPARSAERRAHGTPSAARRCKSKRKGERKPDERRAYFPTDRATRKASRVQACRTTCAVLGTIPLRLGKKACVLPNMASYLWTSFGSAPNRYGFHHARNSPTSRSP